MPLSPLIIAIYRYAELSNGNGMPRDATICTNGRRERRRVLGLAECLLFGRAVDRLYLRSGLSSWPCSTWMAKRNEARWRSPRHTAEQPPLLTGEFTIARCSSFIERLTYIHREIRGERAACVSYGRGYSRSWPRASSLGRKHANVDDEPIISVKGSWSSWTNHSDENTRLRERNSIYILI